MGPIRAEVEIDAPRERVFASIADLAARPAIADHFLSGYHLTRIEPTGVGAGARFRAEGPLRSVWMDTTIIEQEAPFRVVEEGRGGRANRIETHTVWELTPGPGALTTVRLTFWTDPANPLDRALEVLSLGSVWQRRGWRRALQRLREQIESDRPGGERVAVAGGNRHATGVP